MKLISLNVWWIIFVRTCELFLVMVKKKIYFISGKIRKESIRGEGNCICESDCYDELYEMNFDMYQMTANKHTFDPI